MKKSTFRLLGVMLALALTPMLLTNCSKDESFANVIINEGNTDLGGDVIGNGGSTQKSFKWNNPLRRVDWNMDMTARKGGSFNLRIDDSNGNNVLNQTLVAGVGDDSKSGVSRLGTPGEWTITVTLTNFNGDGSFSISPE